MLYNVFCSLGCIYFWKSLMLLHSVSRPIYHSQLMVEKIFCRRPMVGDDKTALAMPASTWESLIPPIRIKLRACSVRLTRLDPSVLQAVRWVEYFHLFCCELLQTRLMKSSRIDVPQIMYIRLVCSNSCIPIAFWTRKKSLCFSVYCHLSKSSYRDLTLNYHTVPSAPL